MEKKNFFQTKEGGLTLAFLVIMAAFAVIMAGLKSTGDSLCLAGFAMIVAAMLYSPVKTFVFGAGRKKNK